MCTYSYMLMKLLSCKDIVKANRLNNKLNSLFEMKDLGRTKFCLGLQIEYLKNGIFIYQETYVKKVLERFYMNKSHPLCTPMVVRSLEENKDPFRPREMREEGNEEIFGPKVPYLSATSVLMYIFLTAQD